MKVSKQRASENRDAIVQVAAAQLRERGFTQMSVADVAETAGLTHGALYSHFKSKEALQAAAVERAFEDCVAAFAGLTAEQLIGRYFSEQHRDDAGHGCPTAALMSEIRWQSEETRSAFHDGFRHFAALLKDTLQSNGATADRDMTMLAFAAMTGTLTISRAVQGVDPALADSFLHTVAGQLRGVLAGPSEHMDRAKAQKVRKRERSKARGAAVEAGSTGPSRLPS